MHGTATFRRVPGTKRFVLDIAEVTGEHSDWCVEGWQDAKEVCAANGWTLVRN
jgi:hypothetical protein